MEERDRDREQLSAADSEFELSDELAVAGDIDDATLAAILVFADRVADREWGQERRDEKTEYQRRDRELRRQRDRLDEQRTDIEALRGRVEALQSELVHIRRSVESE